MGLAPEITRGEMLPAENDSDRETIRQTRQALGVLRDGGWLPQSLEQEVESRIGFGLRHAPADGGSPEDRPRALVACAAERRGRDHDVSLPEP